MRDFDQHNITAAVIDRFAATPDGRLKTIMTSLTRHLHDFVRDVDLSAEEWNYAIDFLTRTGQMCSDTRQEFILLSDTLGISMLVDAINHGVREGATETTVLGPFFVANAPESALGADISAGVKGEPLLVEGSVSASNGQPVAEAVVDVWQSDSEGYYDVQRPELSSALLRAQFRTDGDGKFFFRTIVPSSYPIPDNGPVGEMLEATGRHPNRPAHIHFMIAAPNHEMLITHVFDAESLYLDSDAVFGVKNSLIADFSRSIGKETDAAAANTETIRRLKYDFVLKPTGYADGR